MVKTRCQPCRKTFSWVLVEVLRWIAHDASADKLCGIHFCLWRVKSGLAIATAHMYIDEICNCQGLIKSWTSVIFFYPLRPILKAFFVFIGLASSCFIPIFWIGNASESQASAGHFVFVCIAHCLLDMEWLINNYPPMWRWIVAKIYRDAKRQWGEWMFK